MNRGLFRAAVALAPEGWQVVEVPIRDLPLFDEDLEGAHEPAAVTEFKAAIAAADAVLFITPEYNYGLPGVLKNAIDWGSRPSGKGALNRKPAAMMGVSGGRSGTMRAQSQLLPIYQALDMPHLRKPEVIVTFGKDKFDADQNLTDEATRDLIGGHLAALADWLK